ncbi:MAG: cyclase family protein [Aureispira sp.]
MKANIVLGSESVVVDLAQPISLALPIQAAPEAASAWYCGPSQISPVMTEQFVGSVALGGAVNFRDVQFNPHGNGTHTECVGHIAKEFYSIHQVLKRFFFLAQLWTVLPEQINEDGVITLNQVKSGLLQQSNLEAIVIRTLPNSDAKKQRQYSNTNPPYMEATAAAWLYEQGVRHILIDTPSVDREEDEGVLAAHHAFWNYPDAPRLDATITELIYVPNTVSDGLYLLNLQVAAFENDATPSQPTLYALL